MRLSWRRAGLLAAGAVMVSMAFGCSSSTPDAERAGMKCGSGTVAEGDACVPADAAVGPDSGLLDGPSDSGEAREGGAKSDADSGPLDPAGRCAKNLAGPKLVEVTTANGQSFCIDATEVSSGDYKKFLAEKVSVHDQPAECQDNLSFYDLAQIPDELQASCDAVFSFNAAPMVCTDWCDAKAYCAWAGKRLCGRIGGGTLDLAELSDFKTSEWLYTCSNGGTTVYSYGNDASTNECLAQDTYYSFPRDCGSKPGCVGLTFPYDHVYDLSGNALEWLDACTAGGAKSDCAVVSSDDAVPATGQKCVLPGPSRVDNRIKPKGAIGFRCCADIAGGK